MIYSKNTTKKLKEHYEALALFSGGLDSILAIKLIMDQGLDVLGLHFISPFFGKPEKISEWEKCYGFDILPIDIGTSFIEILQNPRYGYGKGLNPCIDCKILMLKMAKKLLGVFKAKFIITGEIVGQRPMSQRKDTMNIIKRESGTENILLRPLTAKNLAPTKVEEENIVDRSQLLALKGRSRKTQLELAKKFNIKKIPSPAGGCLLTDPGCVNRFKLIMQRLKSPEAQDFHIAKLGRQFWFEDYWLIIGRNHKENMELTTLIKEKDLIFKLADIPGPIGIGKSNNKKWPEELIYAASRLIVRYSKMRSHKRAVHVTVGNREGIERIEISPLLAQETPWIGPI